MFIPTVKIPPSKIHIKSCQIVQKTQETAQILLQTPWHLHVLKA